MILINGQAYFPQYRLKATSLIVLVTIIYSFYLLFRITHHKQFLPQHELLKAFLVSSITIILSISIFPMYIFLNPTFISHFGYGKQVLISFNPYINVFQTRDIIISLCYVCVGITLGIIFHKFSTQLLILVFILIPTTLETIKLIFSYFYILSSPFNIMCILISIISELLGFFINAWVKNFKLRN